MQRTFLPAVAAVAAVVCLGLPSSAQVPPVVVTSSTDDADFAAFPQPAGSLMRTGPAPTAFLRSEGQFESGPQPVQDGVGLPFSFSYVPGAEPTIDFEIGDFAASLPLETQDFDTVLLRGATNGFQGRVVVDQINVEVLGAAGGPVGPVVDANANQPVSIISLRSFNMPLGFTVTGRATFSGLLSQIDARFEAIVADSGAEPPDPEDEPDRDLDGVPDADDNCPDTPNPGQEDFDEDGIGDPCDACPNDADPDEIDLDFDNIPDICDNCPGSEGGDPALACRLVRGAPDETCWNEGQADADMDGIGDICDNCDMVPNAKVCTDGVELFDQCRFTSDCAEGQLCLQPGNREVGLACALDGANLEAGPVQELALANGNVLTLGSGGRSTEVGDPYVLEVKCASSNIAAANIPVFIPSNASFAQVDGCSTATSGDTGDILDPTALGLGIVDVGEKVLSCSALFGNVNPIKSLTRGTFIDDPGPGTVSPNLLMLSVIGATDVTGLSRPVLCEIGETLPVGVLFIDGLGPNDAPTLTPQGLEQFTFDALGRCVPTADGTTPDPADACSILVDSEDVAIEAPVLSSKPAEGTEEARIELVPALDDPIGFRRWQVSLESSRLIAKAAFGLTGFVGSLPENGSFGGCNVPQSLPGFAYDVLMCPPRGGGIGVTNPDLGPSVEPSDGTPANQVPVSYVVQPMNEADASAAGLLPWTTYVVLRGNIDVLDEVTFIQDFVLNDPDAPAFLGVFEYSFVAEDVPAILAPNVTFEGIGNLPGIEDLGALPLVVHAGDFGGDIPGNAVFKAGSSEPPVDIDGDGIFARADNCVNTPNPLQEDWGRVNSIVADRIGRVCQCGNSVAVNGQVEQVDFDACEQALADGDDPTDRCAVTQGIDFSIVDLVTLELKLSEGGACSGGSLAGNACLGDDDCPDGGACEDLGEPTGAEVDQVCIPAVVPPAEQ